MAKPIDNREANRDPITGTPGSHPVATGVGTALGGAAAGVAAGAAGGPVGAAAGAVVGGVLGGVAGTVVGEQIDPTVEADYWREAYATRPYYSDELTYEEMEPAYRYGWEARARYADEDFDSVESTLAEGWEETKHDARLGWDLARDATRDAWNHATPRKPR